MEKLRLLLLPLAVSALVLGFTACGGEGNDEDEIVEVVEASAVGTDPADCKALATQKFLEQTQFVEGPKALQSCEENAEETADNPDSVEVASVGIDGSKATVEVAFKGGDFNGQTFAATLVEVDGDWKMDELTDFVVFDQEKLVSALEEAFRRGSEPLPDALASCLGESIAELPSDEAEELVIGGSADPIIALVEGCQAASAL